MRTHFPDHLPRALPGRCIPLLSPRHGTGADASTGLHVIHTIPSMRACMHAFSGNSRGASALAAPGVPSVRGHPWCARQQGLTENLHSQHLCISGTQRCTPCGSVRPCPTARCAVRYPYATRRIQRQDTYRPTARLHRRAPQCVTDGPRRDVAFSMAAPQMCGCAGPLPTRGVATCGARLRARQCCMCACLRYAPV